MQGVRGLGRRGSEGQDAINTEHFVFYDQSRFYV